MAVPLCHWLSPLWGGHYACPIEKLKLAEAGGLPWLIPGIVRICPEICHLDLVIGPQNPIFPLHQGTGNRAQAKSSPHLFCMAHKLRIVFTFLNSCGKKKAKEEEHSMTQEHSTELKFQGPSVKLYWDTVTPIHFCIVSGCFPASKAEVSSCDRDHLRPTS